MMHFWFDTLMAIKVIVSLPDNRFPKIDQRWQIFSIEAECAGTDCFPVTWVSHHLPWCCAGQERSGSVRWEWGLVGNPSPSSLDVQGLSPCAENTLESKTNTKSIWRLNISKIKFMSQVLGVYHQVCWNTIFFLVSSLMHEMSFIYSE